MDLIAEAKHRLAELEKEAHELRLFVQTAEKLRVRLSGETKGPRLYVGDVPPIRHERKPAQSGLVYETADFVRNYMRRNGDGMKTRELLPIVEAAGIEVGGQNPIATLSARLSTSQMFERRWSQLYLRDEPESETTDNHSE